MGRLLLTIWLLGISAFAEEPVTPAPVPPTTSPPIVCPPESTPAPPSLSTASAEREGLRMRRPWGIQLEIDGPIVGVTSLSGAYQATEFLRAHLHLGQSNTRNHFVAGAEARFFYPKWPAGPTLGLGYSTGYHELTYVAGTLILDRLDASFFVTVGFDYLFESGVNVGIGFHQCLRHSSKSNPYFELGYFL